MNIGALSRVKEVAMNNNHRFHVGAALFRRKSLVTIGANTSKTHPSFKRTYKNGQSCYAIHAEMNILRQAKPGDVIFVMRWSAEGELTMAHPCEHCQELIRKAGIKRVVYSDWDGNFKDMNI